MDYINENTSIVLSIGSLLALLIFVWKISSHMTKLEQNMKSNQHRIDKLEGSISSVKIEERLAKIETDLLRIRKTLEEK